eukprot:TRINITY_DN15959_c2_g1_i2.p1 TRINITY_DN15959_c2_g1~~TRINITY_DN15959_c2_g1_i2.p1  ORF type:complete len:288 (+),score=58.83 TRINITY_DN15959_c2_g1_i2:9-872(+)
MNMIYLYLPYSRFLHSPKMEESDSSKNVIPPELRCIAQEFTKAVLRECGTDEEEEGDPILYSDRELYKFAERYFRRLAGEKNSTKTKLCTLDQIKILRNSLQGRTTTPLSVLFEIAESSGLSEDSINAATQLTLRASGQEDDIEEITAETEVNCISFIAICLSLVPSNGLVDVLDNCVLVFGSSVDILAAVETFASLDSTHRVRLSNLANCLRQNPCDDITPALLRDIHPELVDIESPPPISDRFSSRQCTPIIVSYTPEHEVGDRPGTGLVHQPDILTLFDRPGTA